MTMTPHQWIKGFHLDSFIEGKCTRHLSIQPQIDTSLVGRNNRKDRILNFKMLVILWISHNLTLTGKSRVELYSTVSPTIWGSLRFPRGVLRTWKVPCGAIICTYYLCGVDQYICHISFGTYHLGGACMP